MTFASLEVRFIGGRKRQIPEEVSVELCMQIALNHLCAIENPFSGCIAGSQTLEPHCRELDAEYEGDEVIFIPQDLLRAGSLQK